MRPLLHAMLFFFVSTPEVYSFADVHLFSLPGLPLPAAARLLHTPEALEACVPRFSIQTAHPPQGAAGDAVSAFAVRFATGRRRELRLVSDGQLRSSVFWMGSNGTPLLWTRLELAEGAAGGSVLRMVSRRYHRRVDERADAPLVAFFRALERAQNAAGFAAVCSRLHRDGPLMRHRRMVFS